MSLIEAGEVKLAQVKYLWTIPNFLNVYREYKFMYSPEFSFTIDNLELEFILLVTQHVRGKKKYFNIYMVRTVDESVNGNDKINVKIEFAVLGASDNVVHRINVRKNYSHSKVLVDLAVEEPMIVNHLHNNELKLLLSITTDDYVGVANQIEANEKCQTLRLREFDNFGKLLNNKKFSDVILCVEGKDIYAHKNILANKSPVFEAMFTHEMSETRSNKVKITDIDYETMCELLLYVYTGKLSDDEENDIFVKYSNVLIAANKYYVDSLKSRCEERLALILTNENVLDCFLLADFYDAVDLKKQAIDFIAGNAEKIVELPSYGDFVELHADVSFDVTRALNIKKRKTK